MRAPNTVVEAPREFPYTGDAMYASHQGKFDAIFMGIGAMGSMLRYSTFFGGKESDRTYGQAVDHSDRPVLTGLTFSEKFPLKNPVQNRPGNKDGRNAFISKFTSSRAK